MKKQIKKTWQKATSEQKSVWAAGFVLVALFGLYGYFLNASIFNVVQQKELAETEQKIQGEISRLESRYITLNSDLDMDRARKLGLGPMEDPQYVRNIQDQALTFADPQS